MLKIILNLFIMLMTISVFGQNSTTIIKCDDVVKAQNLLETVEYKTSIETLVRDKIESSSKEKNNVKLVSTSMNPFVFAVHTAYADHRPLSLSPDMIWLLICQGFTKHVDYNAERLRSKFVKFSGKKEITIATESISMEFAKGNPNNPWELMFPAFADSINTYVGNNFANLIVSEFSTTTPTEKAAFEVTLMDAMSSYFDYRATTSCGIPEIYLEGTVEDWKKIKENINNLKGYEIDNWINSLEPVIDEFINAKSGKINHEFWQTIYKLEHGSGGPYIQGWMVKFFPYLHTEDKNSRWNPYIDKEPEGWHGLTTDDFYNGLSKADFTWDYFGTEYKMEFIAGFVGVAQDTKNLTLRPEIGWAVKDAKKVEQKVEGKNEKKKTRKVKNK